MQLKRSMEPAGQREERRMTELASLSKVYLTVLQASLDDSEWFQPLISDSDVH